MTEMIELTVTLKASAGWIWNALTDRGELENWWSEDIVLEPKVGGAFREPWEDDNGKKQLASGKVTALKKEQFIRFTWKEKDWPKEAVTTCTFEIKDNGKNRTLTVRHDGWESVPESKRAQLLKDFKIGWTYHLKELKSYLDE
ncbi:MAG: SRPBCC family protein [Bdellovibrio sp.]